MHNLSQKEWSEFRKFLQAHGGLDLFLLALQDFVILYHECPLISLFDKKPKTPLDSDFLSNFKTLFRELT